MLGTIDQLIINKAYDQPQSPLALRALEPHVHSSAGAAAGGIRRRDTWSNSLVYYDPLSTCAIHSSRHQPVPW